MINEAAGEVIFASTAYFTAQCPRSRLHDPPVFGSFVKVMPAGTALPTDHAPAAASVIDDPFADPAPPSFDLPAGTPDETLFALVYSASTGSAEPGRRPTAYGLDEASLFQEQPQIFDLLATEFSALHIGYARSGAYRPHLPARPPRLHAAVQECSPQEVCAITESPDLLSVLLRVPGDVNADELIAACLRLAYACRQEDRPYLVRMGKKLALLLRDDPERLMALLRKLEP